MSIKDIRKLSKDNISIEVLGEKLKDYFKDSNISREDKDRLFEKLTKCYTNSLNKSKEGEL